MDENKAYEEAKKRAEAKLGFYTHLAVYLVSCVIFYVINMATSPEVKWFYWPILGWGIGVFFHGVGVFLSGSHVVERMTQKELEKLKHQKKP